MQIDLSINGGFSVVTSIGNRILGIVVWSITMIFYASSAVWLSHNVGPVVGIVIYAILTSLLTLLAGWLLHGLTDDHVTWKNRLAGWLLPWSPWVGGGRLHSLLLKNELACLAFGIAVVTFAQLNLWTASGSSHPTTLGETGNWLDICLYWLTLSCWFVAIAAWLWILRSYLKQRSDLVSGLLGKRGLSIPLLLPPVAVGVSIFLRLYGQAWGSLLVVLIPLLIAVFPALLMSTVLLYQFLIGKPIRWN